MNGETVVYLVHGTWAHGLTRTRGSALRLSRGKPRWFDAGSEFRNHLETLVGPDVHFVPFIWSGANTVRARHEASVRLAAQLAADRERAPDVRRLVIAHSHGGNIALRALDRLGEAIPLATLATPFLTIRRRPLSQDRLDALVVGRAVWRALAFVLVYFLVLGLLMSIQTRTGVLLWPALLLMALPVLWRSWRARRRLRRLYRAYAADTTRPLGEVAANSLATATLGTVRRERLRRFVFRATRPATHLDHVVVAIRLPRDEASLALALARVFEQVVDFAWSLAGWVVDVNARIMKALRMRRPARRDMLWSASLACCALGVLFLFDARFSGTPPYSRERIIGGALAAVFLIPLFVTVLRGALVTGIPSLIAVGLAPWLLSVAGILLTPFGVELVRCGLVADAKAGPVPEQVPCKLVVFDPEALDASVWRLRHCVYEHPAIRSALAQWIASGNWPAQG